MSDPRRTVLVTGASKGLGRAIALKFGATGHRVVINYHTAKAEAAEVARVISESGGEAIALQGDVRVSASFNRLLGEARRRFGPIEVIVHNATGPQPMRALEDYAWSDFQDQIDFFVKAPVLLTQAILPELKSARWGRIILIGSEVAQLGNANFSAYVAAKAAMIGLTRSWAREFGPWQITVNLVAPGWIPVDRHAETPRSDLEAYRRAVPLQRQGAPDNIADAVAFVASEQAAFMTGQCLAINGGNTF